MPLSSPLHTQRSVWHIDAETRRRRTYHFIELQLGKPPFFKSGLFKLTLSVWRGGGCKRMQSIAIHSTIFYRVSQKKCLSECWWSPKIHPKLSAAGPNFPMDMAWERLTRLLVWLRKDQKTRSSKDENNSTGSNNHIRSVDRLRSMINDHLSQNMRNTWDFSVVLELSSTYGSVSAGREKWPFNVLFFLKVEPLCDHTWWDSLVFSILSCFSYVLHAKNTLVGPVGPF